MLAILIPTRQTNMTDEFTVELAPTLEAAQAVAAEYPGAHVLTGAQLDRFFELGPDYLETL